MSRKVEVFCRMCGDYSGVRNPNRIVNGWCYCSKKCYYEDLEEMANAFEDGPDEDEWRLREKYGD